MRGAKTAAHTIRPDWGIGVDVTCTNDLPDAQDTCSCKLGEGAAIKVRDNSMLCSAQVISHMEALAEKNHIPNQRDVMVFGGTDGGAMQTTGGGVIAGGISVPCRYTHAPVECIDRKDLKACVDLVVALAESE
jgi:endoglucanase